MAPPWFAWFTAATSLEQLLYSHTLYADYSLLIGVYDVIRVPSHKYAQFSLQFILYRITVYFNPTTWRGPISQSIRHDTPYPRGYMRIV